MPPITLSHTLFLFFCQFEREVWRCESHLGDHLWYMAIPPRLRYAIHTLCYNPTAATNAPSPLTHPLTHLLPPRLRYVASSIHTAFDTHTHYDTRSHILTSTLLPPRLRYVASSIHTCFTTPNTPNSPSTPPNTSTLTSLNHLSYLTFCSPHTIL